MFIIKNESIYIVSKSKKFLNLNMAKDKKEKKRKTFPQLPIRRRATLSRVRRGYLCGRVGCGHIGSGSHPQSYRRTATPTPPRFSSPSPRGGPHDVAGDRSGGRSLAPSASASAPVRRPRWRCGTSSRARTTAPRTAPRPPTPSTPSPTPSSASPPRRR
jgi:hypothetical protein